MCAGTSPRAMVQKTHGLSMTAPLTRAHLRFGRASRSRLPFGRGTHRTRAARARAPRPHRDRRRNAPGNVRGARPSREPRRTLPPHGGHPPRRSRRLLVAEPRRVLRGHVRGRARPTVDNSLAAAREHLGVFRVEQPSEIHLCCGPLYHSAPLGFSDYALLMGQTVVLMERFDAEEFLRLIDAQRATWSMMVPIHF